MSAIFERQLRELVSEMPYPPTPEIKLPERRQPSVVWHPAWGMAAAIVIVISTLVTVPPIRAALRVQLGAVIVEFLPARLDALPLELSEMTGRSDYATALELAAFTVRRPAALPMPDHVFVQGDDVERHGDFCVDRVLMIRSQIETVLYQVDTSGRHCGCIRLCQRKSGIQRLGSATQAVWIDTCHIRYGFERAAKALHECRADAHFVTGNVLIWLDGRQLRTA